MSIEDNYQAKYQSGETPWDIGEADFNLVETVTQLPVPAGKALDIGCGTGDNSLWLTRNGFQVTGTDTAEVALVQAKEKAAKAGIRCGFRLLNFLVEAVEGAPFDFVFDRGCFHSFVSGEDRTRFAENVAAHLGENGLWLSIIGNADERRQGGPGPPRRTAKDIVLAVEPFFEILSLTSGRFGSKAQNPPRAWRCLMRKRYPV